MEASRVGDRKVDQKREPLRLMDDFFDIGAIDCAKAHAAEGAKLERVLWSGRGCLPPVHPRDYQRYESPRLGTIE